MTWTLVILAILAAAGGNLLQRRWQERRQRGRTGDARLAGVLDRALRRHGLLYGAFIDRERIIAAAGEPEGQHGDLVSAHVGPRGSTRATIDSLQGMILPQGAAQGEYFAILDLISSDDGLVLVGRRDPKRFTTGAAFRALSEEDKGKALYEHWLWTKQVADECKAAYGPSNRGLP